MAEMTREASRSVGMVLNQFYPVSFEALGQHGGADAVAVAQSLQHLQDPPRRTRGAIRSGTDGVSLKVQAIASGNAALSQRSEHTASNLPPA